MKRLTLKKAEVSKEFAKIKMHECCICHKVFSCLENRNGRTYYYCKRCYAVRILTHSKYYISNYGLNTTLEMLGVKC